MAPATARIEGLPQVTYFYIRDNCEASLEPLGPENSRHESSEPLTRYGQPPLGSPRYTKPLLQQTLQLLGCKPRYSEKACAKVFLILQQRASLDPSEKYSLASTLRFPLPAVASVSLSRSEFESLVLEALSPHDPGTFADLSAACALQERRRCVIILLCGTSGTGKSTLASLLAARFGISTVVSTDSIRHMLRGFSSPEDQPLLWTSTYQTAQAMMGSHKSVNTSRSGIKNGRRGAGGPPESLRGTAAGGGGAMPPLAVQGYLAQSEAVMCHVERLVASYEDRNTSLIVEGVHLSPALAARLMRRHPSVVPFLIHISNEAKHLERFAVRAKAMTLRPEGNRYVRHLHSIRAIQDHLAAAADCHAVPKVDNTNVDRSVATIHATVLGCLRRLAAGEMLLDASTERCRPVLEEYLACKSATWSGTDMLELIRRKAANDGNPPPSPSDGPSTSVASTAAATQHHSAVFNEVSAWGGSGDHRSFYGSYSQSDREGGDGGRRTVDGAAHAVDGTAYPRGGEYGQEGGSVHANNGIQATTPHTSSDEEDEEGNEEEDDQRQHMQKISEYGSVLEIDEGGSEPG